MALAHDASTRWPTTAGTTDTTSGDRTFTHTPSGTPAGVAVVVVGTYSGTNLCSGVLYGGVAMTLTTSAVDTVETEDTQVLVFTLVTTISGGAQTVTIQSATTGAKFATCSTLTSGLGATVINTSNKVDTTGGGSPLVNLTTTQTTLSYGGCGSGENAPGALTPRTGCTAQDDADVGNQQVLTGRRTSPDAAGTVAFGWTGGTEDFCIAAAAFEETVGGSTFVPQVIAIM